MISKRRYAWETALAAARGAAHFAFVAFPIAIALVMIAAAIEWAWSGEVGIGAFSTLVAIAVLILGAFLWQFAIVVPTGHAQVATDIRTDISNVQANLQWIVDRNARMGQLRERLRTYVTPGSARWVAQLDAGFPLAEVVKEMSSHYAEAAQALRAEGFDPWADPIDGTRAMLEAATPRDREELERMQALLAEDVRRALENMAW